VEIVLLQIDFTSVLIPFSCLCSLHLMSGYVKNAEAKYDKLATSIVSWREPVGVWSQRVKSISLELALPSKTTNTNRGIRETCKHSAGQKCYFGHDGCRT